MDVINHYISNDNKSIKYSRTHNGQVDKHNANIIVLSDLLYRLPIPQNIQTRKISDKNKMNKLKKGSNMYDWITATWNPIKGKCSHDCIYCYMKIFPQKPIRLDEKELKENLGEKNTIFVGSSTDMFAEDVPDGWILAVLNHCKKHPYNTYLFQSKNPARFINYTDCFPPNTILGTTIETNRHYPISKAPSPEERMKAMILINKPKMVTCEPLCDFDLDILVNWIKAINPDWVNIGGDSKNHHLPEPSKEEIELLIQELKKFTEIKIKKNLNRLIQ
jgi:protein gp37